MNPSSSLRVRIALVVCLQFFLLLAAPWSRAAAPATHWVASWSAAPMRYLPPVPAAGASTPPATPVLRAQTVRQRMFPTVGGRAVRVRFSNEFGSTPLHVAAASVALGTGGQAVSPATLKLLSFGGRASITIAPGATAWSDAAPLRVRAGQAVAVSFYVDEPTPFGTVHHLPPEGGWVTAGNAVGDPVFKGAQASGQNLIVTGLDVASTARTHVVVAFGDSITEGADAFAPVQAHYPARLAERARDARRGGPAVAVLNAGISGNRLLSEFVGPSGLDRFERDVLDQSGVTHAIILIGINDIGFGRLNGPPGSTVPVGEAVTAGHLTAGLQRLIDMARARRVKVLLGTVLPIKGSGYWSVENEAIRQAVNQWIRNRPTADATVVDFDAALRDPRDPQALAAAYDSGDHLHPRDAGYAAMAAAVDLKNLLD